MDELLKVLGIADDVEPFEKGTAFRVPIDLPKGCQFLADQNEYIGTHQGYDLKPRRELVLPCGDYSVELPGGRSLEDHVVVERKAEADLLGCVAHDRGRWGRHLDKLEKVTRPHIVIESSWTKLSKGGFSHTAVNPLSVLGSLVAWANEHRISIWLAGNRNEGRRLTEWILISAARMALKKM